MANVTPNNIRGFLVPFKLTADNFLASSSIMTQNGSLSGIPVSQNDSPLVLTSQGTQHEKIEIKSNRAGHVQDGAGFVWRYDGDPLFYGHETPSKIMNISTIQIGASSITYTPRHSLRLMSGSVLITVEYETSVSNTVKIYRVDVDGNITDVNIETVAKSLLVNNQRFPSLVELPNGWINMAMWTVDSIEQVANIVIYQSMDDGQTWTKVSSKAIPNDLDVSGSFGSGAAGVELQNIAMASSQHQVLMLAGFNLHDTDPALGSVMRQYGSANSGLTFKYVDQTEEADNSQFYLPKVLEFNGVFIIGYIGRVNELRFTRISNVFDSIFDTLDLIPADILVGVISTATLNRLTAGDWTMFMDSDGRMYIYAMNTAKNIMYGAYSDLMGVSVEDYGESWSLFADSASFTSTNIVNTRSPTLSTSGGVKNIVGVCGSGENQIFGNWENKGTNLYADGVYKISLGGWSTQQYGKLQPYPDDYQWSGDSHSWCPFDLPNQNSIWSQVGSGTASLGGDHVTIVATGTNIKYYLQGIFDKTGGATLHTRVSNITGGTTTRGTAFGIQIQNKSSTNTYWLEVVLGSNRIHVYDVHSGYTTPIGSATGLLIPNGIQVLCHVDNVTGDVQVYFGNGSNPRQYQKITGTLTLNANTTQQIYWGCPTSGGASRTADYHFFSYAVGDDVGVWSDGVVNSKKYSSRGFNTPIIDNLTISTIDGPAREGDTYLLTPQYGSPIQRTLHIVSPSPHVGWRSDSVEDPDLEEVTDQTIAWSLIPNVLNDPTYTESNSFGIHLTNINFKQIVIQYHTGGSWQTYQTIQNTVGGVRGDGLAGFEFERSGMSIYSNESTGPYLHLNECEGWSILLVPNEGLPVQRRIKSNGDGVLCDTSSKRAYLTIKGLKPTDPSDGIAYLIPSSVTCLINKNVLSAFRFIILAQATAEGYFEIGTMVAGPLVINGPQYGRGRTIQIESNVVETVASNGTLYTTPKGRDGRLVKIAWTDGVDTSSLNEPQADPNYYNLYSGQPIAVNGSAPTAMMGLIQYVKSSQNAIVYLPNIATNPAGAVVLNRYHNQILCTIGTDVQIDHVIGDELLDRGLGEVFRVSTVILREVR